MVTHELLTVSEMAVADRLAVARGIPSLTLMENGGRAVADEAVKMVPAGSRIAVLCGPGNNGGDGFVAARLLAERGFEVEVGCLVERSGLKGDAAEMAQRWTGPTFDDWPRPLSDVQDAEPGQQLIIDAIFGAGLTRPAEGDFAGAIELINQAAEAGVPVLAVDVPSGLDGTTGRALGNYVVKATRTVTFFRMKPGHLLMPGRGRCGTVVLADIGIPDDVLRDIGPAAFANGPALWYGYYPRVEAEGHKYARGHAVVISGPPHATGAARLSARAALRVGAGLVTVASPLDAVAINAAQLTAIMVAPFDDVGGLAALFADPRHDTWLIGPAAGVGALTRGRVLQILAAAATAVVLDADALTSFVDATDRETLFASIRCRAGAVVLTPHAGEFRRLFPQAAGMASKLEAARTAASESGAIIVYKGADTVIAHPDGNAAINDNAPPTLATAGSGDVLAGLVAGLLAQKMPALDAAGAAVWLHGEAASQFGLGLIAEDLPEQLPAILTRLSAWTMPST